MSSSDTKGRILAAIIGGVFVLIAAIITGVFQIQSSKPPAQDVQTQVGLAAMTQLTPPSRTPAATLSRPTDTVSLAATTSPSIPATVQPPTATTAPAPPSATTSSGTILTAGETWIGDGIRLTLERVQWKPDSAWIGIVDLWLYLENNTSHELLVSFGEHNFDLRDNLGNPYTSKCLYQEPYSYVLPAGQGRYLSDSCTPVDSTMFTGDFFNAAVTQLTLTVKQLSRIDEAHWTIDVPH
jgi:hypothetical protein